MKTQKNMMTSKIALIAVAMTLGASIASGAILSVGVGQTYSTITEAYDAANGGNSGNHGDIIEIHEGVYTEFPRQDIAPVKGFITFQRYGDDKVVIRLSSYIYLRNRAGTRFYGLIFDATGLSYGVYCRSGVTYTIFKDCVFFGATTAGIYVYAAATGENSCYYVSVENCTFINCILGYKEAGKVSLDSISDCLFVDNGTAMTLKSDTTVENSAFWNNTTLGVAVEALGTGCVTNAQPLFKSTDITHPFFMYLVDRSPVAITEGSSEGSYMGARLVLPPPESLLSVR